MEFDYSNLVTLKQFLEEGVAFTEGTVRYWLFNRHHNGLADAVVKIRDTILFDTTKFNNWLSAENDIVSDFRNLRTKEQIVRASWVTMGSMNHWLRDRTKTGLGEAVVSQRARKLYIDVQKFNCWLKVQNQSCPNSYDVRPCPGRSCDGCVLASIGDS